MWFLWGASDPRDGVMLSFFLRLLKWISEEDTRIVSWDDVHYVVGSELGRETRDGWRYVGLPLSKHPRDGSVPVRDAQAGRQPLVGILFPRPGNNFEQASCVYGFRGDSWQREVSWVCSAHWRRM